MKDSALRSCRKALIVAGKRAQTVRFLTTHPADLSLTPEQTPEPRCQTENQLYKVVL